MFHHARLLVVQQSQELADNLVELLASLGYRADRAADAAAARWKLGRRHYDCVLLDGALPDTDSAELVAELRQRDPELRIVVMAALLDSAAAGRAERAGATSVVRTFGTGGFVEEVERVLRRAGPGVAGVRSTRYGWTARRRAPNDLR